MKPTCPFLRVMLITLMATSVLAAETTEKKAREGLARERSTNVLGLFTKLLASGVFVVGREAEEYARNDLELPLPGVPKWNEMQWEIDRDAGRLTVRYEDYPPRTAVYNGDQGCTLLPVGETQVHFTPVPVKSTLPPPDTLPWPMGDQVPDTPPAGVDMPTIQAALDLAFDETKQKVPQHTRAMVVVHGGQLVGEWYAPGYTRDTRHISWSMGKSITAALVGILVQNGHFNLHDPAPVPEWQRPDDPRRAITIAHLMNMSSGLDFKMGLIGSMFTSKDHHKAVYFGAVNVFDYSVNRQPEFPPNTVCRYRNCDPLILGSIIRDTVEKNGEEYLTFPQRALFDKIGARNFVLECDPWGNFIMTGFDYGTARDWARFGMLHLQDGGWNGERILPEGWVDFVRTPAPASENKDYGGLFWLNRGGNFSSLPEDAYWPAGHHSQTVLIIPSHDLVIVRLGHSSRGGFDAYFEPIVKMIIEALAT